jgi:phage FluMu protein Com
MTAVRRNLRCGACARLFSRAAGNHDLHMNYPGCGDMNQLETQSLPMDRLERHHEEGSTHERRTDPRRRPAHPADPAASFDALITDH